MDGHKFKKSEINVLLKGIIGKTLGEIDSKNVFEKTKNKPKITGIAGDIIEQSVLGYPPDNKSKPDLNIDGIDVELKTTGIKIPKRKNTYDAKEPVTITAVSPKTITNEDDFYHSQFWHKAENILFVYYHYDSHVPVPANEYARFYIKGYEFHKFNKSDELVLKRDWEIIQNFIKNLQNNYDEPEKEYSRISTELNGKLFYMDTAPKWPHPPRFRLKRSLVNNIVQSYFDHDLSHKLDYLKDTYRSYDEIDEKCKQLTSLHKGKSIEELMKEFNLKENKLNKAIAEKITVRMFGGSNSKINKIDIFNKIGLMGKTITLTENYRKTEDLKLFKLDFDELLDDSISFEDTNIYDFFCNRQILFIIFTEPSTDAPLIKNRLLEFKRVSFDYNFITTEVKKLWEDVRTLIKDDLLEETVLKNKNGEVRRNSKGNYMTSINFPKSKDGNIFIRGSGIDSHHKNTKINNINMYCQYIWIKGSYITKLLNELTPI